MLLRRTPSVDPRAAARVAVLLQAPGGWVPPEPQGAAVVGLSRGRHAQPAQGLDGGQRGEAADDVEDVGRSLPPTLGQAVASRDVEDLDLDRHLAHPTAAYELPDRDHGATADAELDPVIPSALERWRAGRLDPGRRGVAALALVAVLAALLAGSVVLRGRPQPVAPPPVVAAGVPVQGPGAAPPTQAAEQVVVSVGGKVRRPGLVRLPAGSRVDDAVQAAGGAQEKADLGLLNLARRLVDGEQVLVGVPAAPQDASGPTGAADAGSGPVDLNTATLAQLDALSGIGPVLAQRILDWRTENGRFASVDQLREVSGIGESTFADLRSEVTV